MKVQQKTSPNTEVLLESNPIVTLVNSQNEDIKVAIAAPDFLDYVATNPTSGGGDFVAFDGKDAITGEPVDIIRHEDGITLTTADYSFEVPKTIMRSIAKATNDLQATKHCTTFAPITAKQPTKGIAPEL